MQAIPLNPMRNREELKAQRKLLFKRFLRNPQDTSLALKIKIIDDQVAACDEQIELERKAQNSASRIATRNAGSVPHWFFSSRH
jgi:hypothetical protein